MQKQPNFSTNSSWKLPEKATLRLAISLGLTQTIAWASSYYLPAVLARTMADELGYTVSTVYAAFSLALIVAALTVPLAGKCVDKWGGKRVLVASNIWFALGLVFLSQAQSMLSLFGGWAFLGFAMGAGLYDMAFATVVRSRGQAAPIIIVGITLLAGFASTVGWSVTHYLLSNFGWRQALSVWGGIHIFLALPINLSLVLPMQADSARTETDSPHVRKEKSISVMLTLATSFACFGFAAGAMAGHMPALLQLSGVGIAASMLASAVFGPAQVSARLIHLFILRKFHPISTALLATLIMPLGVLALALLGPVVPLAVGISHGFGNGIMSIIKGTLPLSILGEKGYGGRQGILFLPAGVVQALSPFLFSKCIDALGKEALYVYVAAIWIAALLMLYLKWLIITAQAQRA
jgi:MFS family permease